MQAATLPLVAAVALAGALGTPAESAGPVTEDWANRLGGTLVRSSDGAIVEIDLARSWASDVDLERIRGLASLERLDLAQTHISDRALEVVTSLPALRELDLFFCEHVTDAGASILRRAKGLEELNVRGTKIGGSGVRFLAELANLRWLDLAITEIGDPAIELLEALPRLESLAIGGNRIGEPGIAGLRSLKQLRHLDLSGAQVTDSGIWAVTVTDLNLPEVAALSSLESLNLAAPSREYVDAISTGVPRLRGAIRITDVGAAHLRPLARLKHLNLSRSLVSATGLRELSHLQQLEELVLQHAESIDDSAGPAIATLEALQVLDVSFTSFGDAGLASLHEHRQLRRIVAVGTAVSQRAAEAFEQSRQGRQLLR